MEVEEWEIAAGAYRRYCSLNSDVIELMFLFSLKLMTNDYFFHAFSHSKLGIT